MSTSEWRWTMTLWAWQREQTIVLFGWTYGVKCGIGYGLWLAIWGENKVWSSAGHIRWNLELGILFGWAYKVIMESGMFLGWEYGMNLRLAIFLSVIQGFMRSWVEDWIFCGGKEGPDISTRVGKKLPNSSQQMTRNGRRPSDCRRTARIHQDSHTTTEQRF